MYFSWFAIGFALGGSAVHFKIPEIENTVEHILNEYSEILNSGNNSYGPHTQGTVAPYWLESITHQGISAFGPAGYQVFRNVKDFGAKGTSMFQSEFSVS